MRFQYLGKSGHGKDWTPEQTENVVTVSNDGYEEYYEVCPNEWDDFRAWYQGASHHAGILGGDYPSWEWCPEGTQGYVVATLAEAVTKDDAGRHFTEWLDWETLEDHGFITIYRPVHKPSNTSYSMMYWMLEVTPTGKEALRKYGYDVGAAVVALDDSLRILS